MFFVYTGWGWLGIIILLSLPVVGVCDIIKRIKRKARQEEEQARRDRFMKELTLSMEESEREDYRRFYED